MKQIKTKLSYLIEIPKISDEGQLVFTEGKRHLPFAIKRVYYIFDVERGAIRGHHAHKKCQQVLFCIKGKINIVLDNGYEKEELVLDKPNEGIFLDKMMWHEMKDFEANSVLLVFASDYYKEKDYIRDYNNFLKLCGRQIFKSLKDVPQTAILNEPIESIGV